MKKYRIIKHKSGVFYIQALKKFLFFSWWETHSFGTYGRIQYRSLDEAREIIQYWNRTESEIVDEITL
jgi:hypothetical protein